MLANERFAMLDDGVGFSLVPWKPVLEQRLGQSLAATFRGGSASSDFRGSAEWDDSDKAVSAHGPLHTSD